MKKLIVITDVMDCPHFRDGFHKTSFVKQGPDSSVNVGRFGCDLLMSSCNMEKCPLPDFPKDDLEILFDFSAKLLLHEAGAHDLLPCDDVMEEIARKVNRINQKNRQDASLGKENK